MGSRPRVRCWPVVVTLALAHVAAGDPLDDARKNVEDSDYLAARTSLEKAVNSGATSPDDLAEIYKLSGIVEGALGETAAATTAFAKWLSLDPKGALAVGTSPKIAKPFKAAQDQAKKKKPLELKAETTSMPPTVTLVVVNDPMNLVARARVFVIPDGDKEQHVDGKPGAPIDLPHGERLDLRVQALDEHGNRVFELGSKSVPLVITGAETDEDRAHRKVAHHATKPVHHQPDHPRDWYFEWWAWGGAAAVLTLATGYFAIRVHSDLSDLDALNRTSLDHQWHDAQDVESSARTNLLVANITGVTAAVFAAGATLLYLTRPHLEVAPIPTPGGGAVVFGGHF